MIKTAHYKGENAVSYADVGERDGFPILIQHGMIASIKEQQLFAQLVKAGRRVISIARPGYGESAPYALGSVGEWGEIACWLADVLGLAKVDVLGISSGAPYNYAIAHAMPERVRKLFILSGTPALYDDEVLAHWPFPSNRGASISDLQRLSYDLFFAHLPPQEMQKDDILDSMRNDCFGIAQDLKIRSQDWGFRLEDVKTPVYMRHSRSDEAVPFACVERTAHLLPHCRLEAIENDPHFSSEVLDRFIREVIETES